VALFACVCVADTPVDSDWQSIGSSPDGTSLTDVGCACKKKTVGLDGCTLDVKACGCIHHWSFKYKCTVTDEKINRSAEYQYTDSAEGCVKHAVAKLFEEIGGPAHCN